MIVKGKSVAKERRWKGMLIIEPAARTVEALWQDYRFLGKEMLKFLHERDMDLFYELLNQREQLQKLIEKTPDDGFKASPAGRSLFEEIRADSRAVEEALQVLIGSSRQQHKISQAYDVASTMTVNMMKRNK